MHRDTYRLAHTSEPAPDFAQNARRMWPNAVAGWPAPDVSLGLVGDFAWSVISAIDTMHTGETEIGM